MSTLVCNSAQCSHCGGQSNCRCGDRHAPTWNREAAVVFGTIGGVANRDAPGAADAAQASLDALSAYPGTEEDGDARSAASAHLHSAQAHEALAESARADGDQKGAKLHDKAAAAHRNAALYHISQLGDDDAEANGNGNGNGGDDDEDDDDLAENGRRRRRDEDDDDDDEDEECEGDDEECDQLADNRRQPMNAKGMRAAKDKMRQQQRRRAKPHKERDLDDTLVPYPTMRGVIATNASPALLGNAKAEGSNADLTGTDDDDYGYSQAGVYGRDQRTVGSVSSVFGTGGVTTDLSGIFGTSMSAADLDAENAARMGFGHVGGHEQASAIDPDEDGDIDAEIGKADRPATPLDTQRIGVKTDQPLPPRDRSSTGVRQVRNQRLERCDAIDAPIPPTLDEMALLSQAELLACRRRYDRRTGRLVTNKRAPGDSYRLPTPGWPDED